MSRAVTATITGTSSFTAAPVTFRYDPVSPYAVTVDLTALDDAICAHNGEPVDGDPRVWMFERDLLVFGALDGPAGIGDVVIARDGVWLDIRLTVDDESATVRVLAQAVQRFLTATFAEVHLGDESEHLDVDGAIAELLRGVR